MVKHYFLGFFCALFFLARRDPGQICTWFLFSLHKGVFFLIYLYSGTPGSGKSLHSARVIYWALKRGKPVIANFDISKTFLDGVKGSFLMLDNSSLSPQRLIDYSRSYFGSEPVREGAITLFIDECQMLFNARDWAKAGRSDWLYFFTHHRKFGFDIILVAQFDRMIDRQIRSLIEYEIIHRKVSNFGYKGKIISFLAFGNLFVAVKIWYPMKEKVGSDFFRASKRYYRLYDTFADIGGAASSQPEELRTGDGALPDAPQAG